MVAYSIFCDFYDYKNNYNFQMKPFVRKPIGDISLDGLGQDWTLRRYILHLNDI